MEATDMVDMAPTDTARGPLMPMPTMDMAATLAAMEATDMVDMVLATVRGQLRPSPGTDGGDSAEPQLLAVLWSLARTLSPRTTLPNRRALLGASTGVLSRGTLTLRPMPSTAMVDMVDTDLAMQAMVVMVLATPTASKCQSCSRELQPLKLPQQQND